MTPKRSPASITTTEARSAILAYWSGMEEVSREILRLAMLAEERELSAQAIVGELRRIARESTDDDTVARLEGELRCQDADCGCILDWDDECSGKDGRCLVCTLRDSGKAS